MQRNQPADKYYQIFESLYRLIRDDDDDDDFALENKLKIIHAIYDG